MNDYVVGLIVMSLFIAIFAGWQSRKFIERVETLEKSLKTRKFPFRGMEGLEDAVAIGLDVRHQNGDVDTYIDALMGMLLKSERMRQYSDTRIEQMMSILKQVRRDPHSYEEQADRQEDVLGANKMTLNPFKLHERIITGSTTIKTAFLSLSGWSGWARWLWLGLFFSTLGHGHHAHMVNPALDLSRGKGSYP